MKILNRGLKVNGDVIVNGNIVPNSNGEQVLMTYPMVNPRQATVTTKTADYTILSTELNRVFNNAGDDGTQVLTLPSVAVSKGKALKIHVLAAQIMRALPVTGQAINLHGSAVVTKYLNIAGVIGNYADLYCDGTQWIVTGYSGVVTKEA